MQKPFSPPLNSQLHCQVTFAMGVPRATLRPGLLHLLAGARGWLGEGEGAERARARGLEHRVLPQVPARHVPGAAEPLARGAAAAPLLLVYLKKRN